LQMLDHKAATARLTREMLAAEATISEALVNTTALLHSCALAARDNHASAREVQAAFMRAQKTTASLIEARGEAARTHGALLDIYRETAGTAEPYPCPDPSTTFTGAELDDDIRVA
jgi:hypothetical protein